MINSNIFKISVEEIAPKFIDKLVFIVRKSKIMEKNSISFNKVGLFVFFDGCMFWSSLFRNPKPLSRISLLASKLTKNIGYNVLGSFVDSFFSINLFPSGTTQNMICMRVMR
jgi:hypothetical protein